MTQSIADERQNTHSSMLDAALLYAAAGVPIFPVHDPLVLGDEDGLAAYCSCGSQFCTNIGKHPRTPNGLHDATTDHEQVEAWWTEHPTANIGMPTGAVSGLVVIDGDGPTGVTNLEELALSEDAPRAETGGGGLHVFLRHPGGDTRIPNSTGKLAEKVDVRGDGGYVCLAPSLHRSGRRYAGLGSSIMDAGARGIPDVPPDLTRRLESRVNVSEGATAKPVDGPIIAGGRNSALASLAGTMRRPGMSEAAILAALRAENEGRCVPPLADSEVRRIARSVAGYVPAAAPVNGGPMPTPDRPALRAVSFADVPLPGPTRWVVEGLIPEDHQSTIYGEGGKGKSLLALHLGMSVALPGVDRWLGRLIQTAPVLYLDFELDRDTQARRVYELAAGMGLSKPPAGLHYISALGYTTAEAITAAAETVKELGVKLVIVDSVGMALEGDAEASKDVIAFYRNSINALRAAGATPLLIDHQAKKQNGGDKYGNKTEFGSVYKRNNTRSSLQVDSTNDAGVFTMTITHQKANLGPKLPAFTARMVFEPGKISVTHAALTPDQLVEAAPNARQKVLKALEAAMNPMYPSEIADATGLTAGTVKNKISDLRKEGRIVDTGNKDDNGAVQVRLTNLPL